MRIFGLFPGQGGQRVGMGSTLYAVSSAVRALYDQANEVINRKITELSFNGPAEELCLTENAQPAIFLESYGSYLFLNEQLPKLSNRSGSIQIVALAGHSMGEFTALVAAESLSYRDAVKLLQCRGRYMQEAVPTGTGRMIAVLGQPIAEIENSLAKISQGVCEIANVNSQAQVVLSGDRVGIEAFIALNQGVRWVELEVSAPFHCSLMGPAASRLKEDLRGIAISKPKLPVFSSTLVRQLEDPEEIREALYLQVCGQVRWLECVERAIQEAAPDLVVEFGGDGVLYGLMKRINPEIRKVLLSDAAEVLRFVEEISLEQDSHKAVVCGQAKLSDCDPASKGSRGSSSS